MESERLRIGNRITKLRKEYGMSQTQLAETLGMQQSAIARIESGNVNVGFDTLQKIAEHFGLKIDFTA